MERAADTITVTCPGGSTASFPIPGTDAAAAPCSVSQADGGAVTITCPNGSVTVPAPVGSTLDGSTPDGSTPTLQSKIIVGPTRAACGACHDSKAARGHFEAMTVQVDGELQETCGTCHNETSIEPVSRLHARPELGAPGLKAQIGAVSIDPGTRKATLRITLTDNSNAPVARTGLSFSFLIAKVPVQTRAAYAGVQNPPVRPPMAGAYESYLTRTATQVDTTYYPLDGGAPRVSTQPTTERDGTFVDVSPGVYDYTFKFALPVGYDPSLTHMVALYVTRTVDGVRFVANAEKFFVPADSNATPLMRAAVGNTACNSCHNPLSAHGGSRQDVQLCLGCHTQGATDPESGNSIDFDVMIHRIHRGKDLPSVKAGTPYRIIGNSASLHDFGTVGFPQDIKNCQTCHNTLDDRWITNGTKAACTSCHDDIYAPGKHVGTLSPQTTCGNANCHSPGGLSPDASEAHLSALNDTARAVFDVAILSVTAAGADAAPQVRIRARTGTVASGAVTAVTNPDFLQTLNVFLNGPNSSYRSNGHNITQFAKAALVGLASDGANPGEFTFALPKTLRELTVGMGDPEVDSYTLSLRAAYDPTPATVDTDRVDMSKNPSKEFGAGEEVAARLPVVDTNKCNSCHGSLTAHGGGNLARNVEQCAMCHTATMDTSARQSANKVAGPTTSLRFSTMVHRIHAGGVAEQPYLAYGFSAVAPPFPTLDFSNIGFPGSLKTCTTCHVGNSFQLPLPFTTAPSETVRLDADGGVVGQ